jgi:uncharacterized repeat protein (TIGR03803 family)
MKNENCVKSEDTCPHLPSLHDRKGTSAMTEPVSGRTPLLILLIRLFWAAVLVLPTFDAQAAIFFTTLHSFQVATNGANPEAGLVQGSDGNFYGTTSAGGAYGYGTVFEITTNGALAILHSFTNGTDGVGPVAGLVQGKDGNFYGTTSAGGVDGDGTVFEITASGVLTGLHSFTGGEDGSQPMAGLVQGSDGNFYGTTSAGDAYGYGNVFKLTTNGALTTLHSFTNGTDGASPVAGLVQDSNGNFYGTTVRRRK